MRKSTVTLTLTFAFTTLAACARPIPVGLQQPVGESLVGGGASHEATDAAAPTSVDGYIAGDTAGPCGTDLPTISFDAMSSDVTATQLEQLQRIAGCLTTGPFEKASVVLVGYTDVMGTASSNLELGLARAENVMRRLIDKGVAPGRIVVASAGELQRPQASWGLDAHRVEILVARGGPVRPNEAPVARGIDADGLIPRPRVEKVPATAPAARGTTRPSSARTSTPRGR